MDSLEKIKLVTNYDERVVNSTFLQLPYLDCVSPEDEELIRQIKQKNRELKIDAVIDGKEKELKESMSDWGEVPQSDNQIFSMKVFSMNIPSKRLESYDKVWTEILNLIDNSTKNQKKSNQNLDVQISGDFEVDKRKVIGKIVMSSNIISMEGRMGPGNVAIVGLNCIQYIDEYIGGLKVILDLTIDPDKIIILRKSNIDHPGIILINDIVNGNYFLKETPTFKKQMCWFCIK